MLWRYLYRSPLVTRISSLVHSKSQTAHRATYKQECADSGEESNSQRIPHRHLEGISQSILISKNQNAIIRDTRRSIIYAEPGYIRLAEEGSPCRRGRRSKPTEEDRGLFLGMRGKSKTGEMHTRGIHSINFPSGHSDIWSVWPF